jgi:hypothetical protein
MAKITVTGPKEYILKVANFAAIELEKIEGFEKYGAGFDISGVSKQEALDMIPDTSEFLTVRRLTP